jgi:hypothetical protein
MEIGKAIYNILTSAGISEELTVHPEVAPVDSAFPVVVYSIQNIQPSDTKNSTSTLDECTLELYCMSASYPQCMDISSACRNALDRVGGTFSGVGIQSIQFETAEIRFNEPQECYEVEQIYSVRMLLEGSAPSVDLLPLSASTITIQEVDGTPSGAASTLQLPNGTLSLSAGVANYSPVYEIGSFYMSSIYYTGGTSAIDVSSSTPVLLPVHEELQTVGSSIASTATGVVLISAAGYYRLSASVTFDSDVHGMCPHFYFQIESRQIAGEAGAMIPATHGVDHQPANLTRIVEVNQNERVSIRAYDESNKSGSIYVSSCYLDIEKLA